MSDDRSGSQAEHRAMDGVLLEQIHSLRIDLTQHMKDEEPMLRVVEGLGPVDEVRVRIQFVNMLMQREQRRQELHNAVVKGTILAGVIALLAFLGHAILTYSLDMLETARALRKAKP